MNGTGEFSPDMGPGPYITNASLISLALLVTVTAVGVLIAVTAAVCAVRDRRRRRRAAEADLPRYSRDEVDAHLDCLATHDPEVEAALARLDAAVRGQRKGEQS
ncbi:hypothetical protein AB0958_09690 [Streptomyces sp. NPDC006655]|uniref:hypothetical protein n=1 Tax=Streptomyces sp. NPDC006655 TaxID=3156898 RepID=UPI003456DEFA